MMKEFTRPFTPTFITCKSGLHCSQKYSSGLMASSMMPTQPPCCHTLQVSHWMNSPPASSSGGSEATVDIRESLTSLIAVFELRRVKVSGGGAGMPGYSWSPQIQRVTSSSSASSSSPPVWIVAMTSLSSSTPRFRWRVCGRSPFRVSWTSSVDSDRGCADSFGDRSLWFERVLLSARLEELEDVEELVC